MSLERPKTELEIAIETQELVRRAEVISNMKFTVFLLAAISAFIFLITLLGAISGVTGEKFPPETHTEQSYTESCEEATADNTSEERFIQTGKSIIEFFCSPN